MNTIKLIAFAALAAGVLALPAAHAQCPPVNTYPFTAGCPLPAAQLNAAIAAAAATPVSTSVLFAGAGDAINASGITTTAGSVTFGGLSLGAGDVGKLIAAPGAGVGGSPHVTTVATPTTFANPATSTVNASRYYGSGNCDVNAAGGSIANPYAPGDTITLAGGTGTIPTQCAVVYTSVTEVTATATATSDGPCTFTGSSGTSASKFQATGTVTAGVLTGPFTITWSGTYTANPTLAADPIGRVLGCANLSGTAAVGMGIYAARRSTNGLYTAAPSMPAAQASTSGSGTGATLTVGYTAAGTADYGTDNAPSIAAAMALTGSQNVKFLPGTYLTSSCTQVYAASAVSFYGDGRDTSIIKLVPECVFPNQGWLTWQTKSRTSVRNLGIDLNHALRNNNQMAYPLYFEGTAGEIDSIKVINGTTRMSPVGISAGAGVTLQSPRVSNSYFQLLPHFTQNECIAFSQFGGTIVAPMVLSNVCVGSGIQIDGVAPVVRGNDISGVAFGTGIFVPGTSTNPLIAHNQVRNGALGYDVNQAPAGGIENDAPDAIIVDNQIWDNGGGGVVNFGPRAVGVGNVFKNNGKSLGLIPALDFKVYAGWRNSYNTPYQTASATLIGNTAVDNGTGGQNYGFSEDSALGAASVLKGNTFVGLVAETNINNAGTVVDSYSTLKINNVNLPLAAPRLTQALNGNPTGTASATNVMMGLGGTATITPATTGKVWIVVRGSTRNSASGSGGVWELRTGTGTAPANGAAVTGTARGTGQPFTVAANAQQLPFSLGAEVTGLALGVPIWVDLTGRATTSGTVTLSNVDIILKEVE